MSDFIKNVKKIKIIKYTYCSLIYKYCLIYYFKMTSYLHMLFLTTNNNITKTAESILYVSKTMITYAGITPH